MQEFKVGDTVRIATSSEYYYDQYDQSKFNPKETDGTITEIDVDELYPIDVLWETKSSNCYKPQDLILIDPKPKGTTLTKSKMKELLMKAYMSGWEDHKYGNSWRVGNSTAEEILKELTTNK
jgi:hypothetical protein